MAEAPSPYAPGIITEEKAPPRPPGRPIGFLVATFVMTVLVAALSQTWTWRLKGETTSLERYLFLSLSTAPTVFALLWAYLVDRVPLLGSRREGYLILSTSIAVGVWLAVAATDDHPLAWRAGALSMGVADIVSRATILGALAEIGRRRATTGRLAAANVGLSHFALFAGAPAMIWLGDISTWAPAGVAAGLALAVVLLILTLADEEAPAPAPETRVSIPRFLRSRTFWSLLPLLVCAGAAIMPSALIGQRLRAVGGDDAGQRLQEWFTGAARLAPAIAYALLCRRIRFRHLLRISLLVQALALLACARLLGSNDDSSLGVVRLLFVAGYGLVSVAVCDLALRAAPLGREAFGVVLLIGVSKLVEWIASSVALALQAQATFAWFAAGAAIAAALAASLVPRAIADSPDS